LLAGLKVAVIGSLLLAGAECAAAAVATGKHFHAEAWLVRLVLAVLGKNFLTHLIVWTPVLLVTSAVHWWWTGSRTGRLGGRPLREVAADPRQDVSPKRSAGVHAAEPALLAVLIALAGLIVVPADLELASVRGWVYKGGAIVGALLLAVAVRAGLRRLHRRIGPARFGRIATIATCVCAVAAAVALVEFVRSPLFNPAAYRLDTPDGTAVSRNRPNVVWIVLDTVRPDRTSLCDSCYPRDTTPFLRGLLSESLVFDRCLSNGIWTVPSHAAMFTGLSLRQHGMDHHRPRLDDGFVTMAEALRDAGYRTAAFSNNPWISPQSNLTQGFQDAYVTYHLRHLTRFSWEYLVQKWGLTPPLPWLDPDLGAAMTNRMIGDWLRHNGGGDQPVFLFVNYMEAHLPYAVPASYRRMFMKPEQVARSYELRQRAYGSIVEALTFRFNIDGPDFLPPADREVLKLQYDATIRYLDDRVKELIGFLEHGGWMANSLVVICSDHGEHLDTHGLWAHQFQAYNDLARTALILRDSSPSRDRKGALAKEATGHVGMPVQLSDLYPTVLKRVLGSAPPNPAFGARDLFEIAEADLDPQRIVITEFGHPDPAARKRALRLGGSTNLRRLLSQTAAQDARHKYVLTADGEEQLFDLEADPDENFDILPSQPEAAQRLSAYVKEWTERVPAHPSADTESTTQPDPDLLKALRSLGYLGGE